MDIHAVEQTERRSEGQADCLNVKQASDSQTGEQSDSGTDRETIRGTGRQFER